MTITPHRLLCEEKTGVVHAKSIPLLELLDKYFAKNEPFHDCVFSDLQEMSSLIYRRYMTNQAHDDALGHAPRPAHYGQPGPVVQTSQINDPIEETSTETPTASKPSERGDRALANTVNFMRFTCWYLEFCSGVAEGDIGRVLEIIKVRSSQHNQQKKSCSDRSRSFSASRS